MNRDRTVYNATMALSDRLKASKQINYIGVYKDQLRHSLNFLNDLYRYGHINHVEHRLLYRATLRTYSKYIKKLSMAKHLKF